MEAVVDIVSWAALVGGGFFYVVGAIGLNRMPDIFTRMHAVSVSESLGVGLLILGMALQAGFTLVTVKLFIIMVVMMWTGSVAAHALARAALHDGEKPLLADKSGNLVETDPVDLFPELGARLVAPLRSEVLEADLDGTQDNAKSGDLGEVGYGDEDIGANPDADRPGIDGKDR